MQNKPSARQLNWRKIMNSSYEAMDDNLRQSMSYHCGEYAALVEYGSIELHLPRQCGKTTYLTDVFYRVLRDKPNANIFYIAHNGTAANQVVDEMSFALRATKASISERVKTAKTLAGPLMTGFNFEKTDKGGEIIILLDEVSINRFHSYIKTRKFDKGFIDRMKIFSLGTGMHSR